MYKKKVVTRKKTKGKGGRRRCNVTEFDKGHDDDAWVICIRVVWCLLRPSTQ